MATYSAAADLLLGDVDVPPAMSGKYVQDAADEIDSKLAFRYVTPIIVTDTPATRSTLLLLKRINNWLASGRLILARGTTGQVQDLHAYGAKLIADAEAALAEIASGDFVLPGATLLNPDDAGTSGPIINNLDAESNVESFYGFVQKDPATWLPGTTVVYPAGSRRFPYTW